MLDRKIFSFAVSIILIVLVLLVPLGFKPLELKPKDIKIENIMVQHVRSSTPFDLGATLKDKVTILYYTSGACPVCMKQSIMFEEIPKTQKQYAQWVAIMGSPVELDRWMQNYSERYDVVASDINGHFADRLNLNVVPVTILVGPNQQIIAVHRGYLSKDDWQHYFYPSILESNFDL